MPSSTVKSWWTDQTQQGGGSGTAGGGQSLDERVNQILGPGEGPSSDEYGEMLLERIRIEQKIAFDQDVANLYDAYGGAAEDVSQLERWVDSNLQQRGYHVYTSGETNTTTGAVSTNYDSDSVVREATEEHEAVHKATINQGLQQFRGQTPEFRQWLYNPVNWAADEVAAYGASIKYYQMCLGWL